MVFSKLKSKSGNKYYIHKKSKKLILFYPYYPGYKKDTGTTLSITQDSNQITHVIKMFYTKMHTTLMLTLLATATSTMTKWDVSYFDSTLSTASVLYFIFFIFPKT